MAKSIDLTLQACCDASTDLRRDDVKVYSTILATRGILGVLGQHLDNDWLLVGFQLRARCGDVVLSFLWIQELIYFTLNLLLIIKEYLDPVSIPRIGAGMVECYIES